MQQDILEFQGQHRWLSNFWPVNIELDGIIYKSVEHAYMSAKSDDPEWKKTCAGDFKPGMIKKMSRSKKLAEDWDVKKLIVMEECIRKKFTQEPFKLMLVATGNCFIQEGNHWGDTFWGIDMRYRPVDGKNHLGRLIMKIRNELHGSI